MKKIAVLMPLLALMLAGCGKEPVSSQPISSNPTQSSEASSQSAPDATSVDASSEASTEVSSETSSEASSEISSLPDGGESSDSSSSEPETLAPGDFYGEITSRDSKQKNPYQFVFHYDSSYFFEPNRDVSLKMMMFAYGMANASSSHERASKVFAGAGFDEHFSDATLSVPTTIDSIGYAIGSRKEGDTDLIVVSVRGENYQKEWSSNFYSAPLEEKDDYNGDHYGFHTSALKVMDAVDEFVDTHQIQKAKYLFTGYSRGAAVAGMAAAMMIDQPIACQASDVYAYTFEAPAGMLAEHNKVDYAPIHNFVNENDLIPMVMPASYGFVRPGHDIFIAEGIADYQPLFTALGLGEVLLNESSDFSLFELTDEQGNPLNSGKAAFSFLLEVLTRELDEQEIAKGLLSYHTREDYCDNLMQAIRDLMDLIFGLNITIDLETDTALLFPALSLLANLQNDDGFEEEGDEVEPYDPHGLATFMKNLLSAKGYLPEGEPAEDGAEAQYYDATVVDRCCDALQAALRNLQLGLVKHYVGEGAEIGDARGKLGTFALLGLVGGLLVNRHTFDTTYAVLCHYVEVQNNLE